MPAADFPLHRTLLLLGTTSGLLGVAIGAFAAHLLKSRLDPELFNVFEVGVRYQFYHALAIVLTAILWQWLGAPAATAGWLFVAGTVLFSGSLYALSLSGQRWFGAVTPLGGVLFLAGWAVLIVAAARR